MAHSRPSAIRKTEAVARKVRKTSPKGVKVKSLGLKRQMKQIGKKTL